ncbi:hypothetical protein KFE25_014202 [Diacronema lutheri]|uniref:Alanine--tRNA ligase n=1 Tax=Diacronema lutheri TaxID=2081491 RepID=A0A8J6C2R0_DIALT|nr:hypothetical protein KFE25_014202 [Diacronema lutheri]
MASVQDYIASHALEAKLSAVVNELIAALPAAPFQFLAARLRAAESADAPAVPPTPAAPDGAALQPEIASYLTEHDVADVLEGCVNAAVIARSPTPLATIADLLDAHKSRPTFRTTAQVRKAFIDYFTQTKGVEHTFWASSPVVPLNDPTLLFINSGMNQFKPIFLGKADPSSEMAQLKRAANSQKCIRAGGKHNDLDDVGKDVYHHTFFEMLGNWSFGDYFKEEAITWAWQLLTEVYGIDPSRLYITYFEGCDELGVPADVEARDLWCRFVPPERVLAFGMKDNFWEMGETGPCGPCSEIHFDRIGGRDAAALVNQDDPDVLEIWNLVFMQFNREQDRTLIRLPRPCVDTGMGLERVASVLLDKRSNYDIDLFAGLFDAIRTVVGPDRLRPYAGKVGAEDADLVDMAYRVVADHIRTLTFSIADGALPSNEGRGYVLRRILRRAVRYGADILKAPAGFFHQLVAPLVELMGDAFPELRAKPNAVAAVIQEEEAQFTRTLANGLKEFTKRAAKLQRGATLPGGDVHALFTSFGFPPDLTELMAAEKGLAVDMAAFDALLEKTKQESRGASAFGTGGSLALEADQLDKLSKLGVLPTDDSHKYAWDVAGARGEPLACTVRAIYAGQKEGFLERADAGREVGVVLDATPFYAEQGGQVYDTGSLLAPDGSEPLIAVGDVQKFGGYVLHIGTVGARGLEVGARVSARVDYARRAPIARNHTMTHVLNLALRSTLGDGCDQRGSLVTAERARFDFAFNRPLTDEETAKVEADVRAAISAKLAVHALEVPLKQAQTVASLRCVFGEAYPDPVRVLSVGVPVDALLAKPTDSTWADFSIEFCGGTHLANTAEAEAFALLQEEGVARGVRRIVCTAGAAAKEAIALGEALGARVDGARALDGERFAAELGALKVEVAEAVVPYTVKRRLQAQVDELASIALEAAKASAKALLEAAKAEGTALGEAARGASSKCVVAQLAIDADAKAVDAASVAFKAAAPDTPSLLFGVSKGALSAVAVSSNGALSAKEWLGAAIAPSGGKGGGNAGRAMGASRDASQVAKCVEEGDAFAASKL